MRRWTMPATALMLAACSGAAPRAGPAPFIPVPRTTTTVGLERVIGQTAGALGQLFGTPQLDLVEGTGRKIQFGSQICVLDAYLYPKGGRGEPVVTHVDARQRDGSSIDRASCVAALTRARGGR